MGNEWWRWDGAPTPEEWNALFVALTFVVAFVAAIVALVQYRAHLRSERDRTRPYVIVDYAFRSILMQVEIKNIGTSAAANVHLTVDPPFESTDNAQASRLNAVFSPTESIAMLAPGRRILYSFDRAPDYYKKKLPERYTVTARYKELPPRFARPWRNWLRKREVEYTDTFPLDFRQWSQATTESDYDNMNWNIAKRSEAREKKIVDALQSIARSADESAKRPSFEYIIDVAQEVQVTRGTATEHPVLGSQRELPVEPFPPVSEPERGSRTSRNPLTRWLSSLRD